MLCYLHEPSEVSPRSVGVGTADRPTKPASLYLRPHMCLLPSPSPDFRVAPACQADQSPLPDDRMTTKSSNAFKLPSLAECRDCLATAKDTDSRLMMMMHTS